MRWQLFFVFFIGVTLALFWPAWRGEFIMDDWGYIVRNPYVTGTSSPWIFWSTLRQPDYWPLTYTFYWVLYRLFGENPLGYHMVNFVLHAGNATLVYVLARQFNLKWPFWAALLFLVHPLHVQAVAWIVQFKTLLAAALALGSAVAFAKFLRGQGGYWILSFCLFVLACLAKTSVVFLPLVLVLLPRATGKLGRVRALPATLPFFAVSSLFGWITLRVNEMNFLERTSAVFNLPFTEKLLLAGQNLLFYLTTFAVPYPLSFIYPQGLPAAGSPALWWILAGLVALAVFLWRQRRVETRIPFVCYLLLLFPALGFVSIPNMRLSLTADHWAYFPDAFLAIFVASIVGLAPGAAVRWLSYAIVLPLAWLTHQHAKTFAAEETFWKQSARVAPLSAVPAYNLGTVYDRTIVLKDGSQTARTADAIAQYERAVQLDPKHVRAWYNLGRNRAVMKDKARGIEAMETAISLDPKYTPAYIGIARVHAADRDGAAAREILNRGLAANPGNADLIQELQVLPVLLRTGPFEVK